MARSAQVPTERALTARYSGAAPARWSDGREMQWHARQEVRAGWAEKPDFFARWRMPASARSLLFVSGTFSIAEFGSPTALRELTVGPAGKDDER
jgi:hypothetical protein